MKDYIEERVLELAHYIIRSTEQIKADNPDVKAVESYAELMVEIKKVMGIK